MTPEEHNAYVQIVLGSYDGQELEDLEEAATDAVRTMCVGQAYEVLADFTDRMAQHYDPEVMAIALQIIGKEYEDLAGDE